MLFNIVFIFVCFFCLSLSSCYNGNIVTEEQGKPIVIEHNMIMTPQEMGQFHNDVLNCMIEKSEANQISDFNGFMKQIMDVSQFEMAKREFFYDYTSQDSLFVNTAFRVFRDLVREDQQQALDFLVLISDYPDDVKLELMELTRESPDVDYFVNRLNEIVNGQESTRCIEDNIKQSFDIISSISISSNNYWSKKLNSRSSFGTYLADGLVRAALREFRKMHSFIQQIAGQLFQIRNLSYRNNRKPSQMTIHDNRLRVRVTDNADSGISLESVKFRFKLSAKVCTLQTMNHSFKTGFVIVCSHTAAACTGMRIVVRSIKQIGYTTFSAYGTKKSSHKLVFFRYAI